MQNDRKQRPEKLRLQAILNSSSLRADARLGERDAPAWGEKKAA
jgi:hypothetical protein